MSRCPGFTLLETFIATLLMAIMLLALMGLYPAATASIRRGEHILAASDLAQEALEHAMQTVPPSGYSPVSPMVVDGVAYTVSQTVNDLPTLAGRQCWDILETVSWWSNDGSKATAATPETLTFQTVQYEFVNPK